MRTFIHKHPIVLAMAASLFTLAVTMAIVNYYLNSVPVLPLL
jgi:hypothetical protein